MTMKYEFDAVLHEQPDCGGAYVAFPGDIRRMFGKGRVRVHALFDGIPTTAASSTWGSGTRTGRCAISLAC